VTTPRPRRGVTLIELLLVLALLVIIAALAWPMLQRSFESQRLRKAADLIEAEWGRARVQAMSTGRIHIFQYVVGGGGYATHRRSGCEVSAGDAASQGPAGFGEAAGTPAPLENQRTLPDGVTFAGSQTAIDSRAEMAAADSSQLHPTDQGWSEPIFFYPDGTTSTARLVLANGSGRTIELALRGLTGVVTVSDVAAQEGGTP
jgi:prepilin-type N-terminal cleavage/methylation domain-containing protein